MTVQKLLRFVPMIAGAMMASPGQAQEAITSGAVRPVLDCMAIKDATARLNCFDGSVRNLGAAMARGDVAIIDKEVVVRDQRENFGRSAPKIERAPHADAAKSVPRVEPVDEISAKVNGAVRNGDGQWIITLEDGARWQQIDSTMLGRFPKAGSTALIKRAALGSFRIKIDNGPAFKARRLN